jgi:hypothetical protein
MSNVPPNSRGIASGTLATSRNIGMVLGVAFSGALFSIFSGNATALYSAQGMQGTALQQNAFVYGLHFTYIAASAVAVFATLASLTKGKVIPAGQREGQ